MNALPNPWMQYPPTSTVSGQSVINIVVLNKLVNALSDTEMYESDDEPKPDPSLINDAAKLLSATSLDDAEIAPCFGEINVTWKANGVRVKATFGPGPAFYVYKEAFEDGRVAYSHLQDNASLDDLQNALQWLANPLLNVR